MKFSQQSQFKVEITIKYFLYENGNGIFLLRLKAHCRLLFNTEVFLRKRLNLHSYFINNNKKNSFFYIILLPNLDKTTFENQKFLLEKISCL